MDNFAIYSIGYAIMLAGLVVAGFLLGVPPVWLGVGAIVLAGLGIMSAVRKTKHKES
ncbi:MAG: hypothetical protein AAGA69_05555 [Pseudomonadota bacterium]